MKAFCVVDEGKGRGMGVSKSAHRGGVGKAVMQTAGRYWEFKNAEERTEWSRSSPLFFFLGVFLSEWRTRE